MRNIIAFIVAATLGLTLAGPGWLLAQDEADSFTLEEITVTAQKREENVQKVAATMEVITGAEMVELGMNDVDEILSNLSSVLITKGTDGMKVSLRGVSQDGQPFGGLQTKTPTVALNMDGVYSNRNSSGQNLFDIERVEVLYGPQSTMYASATPGGIVNIVTADPKLEKYEAKGSIEYGNYELLHMEGALNAPITDTMALRASFSTTDRDGYLTNGAEDEDSKVARLKYKWSPSETLSIVLTGEIEKAGGQGFSGVELFVDPDDVSDPWSSEDELPSNPKMTDKKKGYAHIVWDTGVGELTLLPSILNKDFSTSSTGTNFSGEATESDQVGEVTERGLEARMTSPDDFFIKWIAGFNYYYSEEVVDGQTYLSDDGTLSSWYHRYVETASYAGFGNVTYPVTDVLRLTGGIRYTQDDTTWYNMEDPAPPGKEVPEVSVHDFDNWGYKAGLEYDIAENAMLFADITTGHRVVGSGTDRNGNPLPPEEITTFTVGSKNRFWDNRFQLNGAAYYYDYRDQIATTGVNTIADENDNGIRDQDPETGEWLENDTMLDEGAKSVGDLEVYGVDLQTSTILTPNDKLDVSISYVKKTWSKLYFDFWDITNSIGLPDLDYSGKTATFAPEWTVNVSYEHNFTLPNGGSLVPRYDGRFQSKYSMFFLDTAMGVDRDTLEPAFTDVTEAKWQEAHMNHDVSLVYTHSDGKWTLTGYVKNLTEYPVKKQIRVQGTVGSQLMIGPPRTYGVVLSARF